MPFRTRDFGIFLVTVCFLLIAIVTTISKDLSGSNSNLANINSATGGEDVIYEAVIREEKKEDKSSQLEEMRKKIALVFNNEEVEEEIPVTEEEIEPVEVENTEEQNQIVLCPQYSEINPSWSPTGVKFEVVEGARILYREVEAVVPPQNIESEQNLYSNREVLLQLPLRTFPSGSQTCLSNNIVGVALDGSLIRNDDYGVYGIFGEETLIGYALDGFPIYGQSGIKLDTCGGVMVNGSYQYFLSKDREGVLGCYSGLPISI
jgi:hypothetical protein